MRLRDKVILIGICLVMMRVIILILLGEPYIPLDNEMMMQ